MVSKDEEVIPVDVIAKALPNIAPNVLLNKREVLLRFLSQLIKVFDKSFLEIL